METTKSIFQSKTFWVNVATGIIGATTLLTSSELTKLGISEVHQNQILFALGGVSTIANIYLRAISSTAVTTPLSK